MAELDKTRERNELVIERASSVEEPEQSKAVTIQIPRVSARTITGPANVQNAGAFDWGYHGLLAYGSNYTIVVIDPKNVQPIQCLDKHKSVVNKVLWGRSWHDSDSTKLLLVSSDTTGHIIVWNVISGIPEAILVDGNKPVVDMKWVSGYDDGNHMLAALHPPYSFIIWNIKTKSKLWKKVYTESLCTFSFDPFEASNIAFGCTDCILFVDDFTLDKIPSSIGKKFYISSPHSNSASSSSRGSMSNLTSIGQEEKQKTRDRLRRLMKDLVIGETRPKPDACMTVSECLQMQYHNSLRHHLILLYAREILLLDLKINQTVGIVPLEKSASPFQQVISTRQRDVLYCLHESGSVSVKFHRRQLAFVGSPLDAPAGSVSSVDMGSHSLDVYLEMGYEQRCQSDMIKHSKGSKVLTMALNPVCERKIALFVSTGKIVFLELRLANSEFFYPVSTTSRLTFDLPGETKANVEHKQGTLSDLIGPLINDNCPPMPQMKLLITGLLNTAAFPLTVIRMCPPLTTRNWHNYVPLLAAGTMSGIIQIFNMSSGTVDKEFAIHTHPIRGIEWTNLTGFISYAYKNITGPNTNVQNELYLTDILTGNSLPFRVDKGDEPPIDIVRVSPLRQYIVILLKDGPFELWDLRNLCILRSMPKKFPNVTALEWSPIHNLKSLKKKLAHLDEKEQTEPTNLVTGSLASDISQSSNTEKHLVAKEHFVFSDHESQLYHFAVEGTSFGDGIKIPPEAGVSTITCIAFKNDQIVQGDVDGMLNIWDLKARTSRNVHTNRGWIKKMRFAPGKGNLKLLILYSDGVDIVDVKKQFERISQLKCPKDMMKILDIDWAASDKAVLATQDGCLRIMDISLDVSFSPLAEYELQDPVFCPALLPPAMVLKNKLILTSQYWKNNPQRLNLKSGFSDHDLQVLDDLLPMMDEDLVKYLESCRLGTAERSLVVAQLFGSSTEIDFWKVALYYLQVARLEVRQRKSTDLDQQPGEILNSPTVEAKRINRYPHLEPLDTCYDVICDQYIYQKLQLERVCLHESKRGEYEHTKKVIEQLILLGETDKAVQLLLETDIDNANYYIDAIKACLVATIQSTGAAQSTIKLVATNLIANGNIWEGVQLLCLIGKGLDACRYLLSYNMWESAVWLAKAVLPLNETNEVLRKWAEHLWTTGQKHKSILVQLSMCQFERVLELLVSINLPIQAGLLLQACKEFGLLPYLDNSTVKEMDRNFSEALKAVGSYEAALVLSTNALQTSGRFPHEVQVLAAEEELAVN